MSTDMARTVFAGGALAVSVLPFVFGWLARVTRDSRDRRAIDQAKQSIRQLPSFPEMFRLHVKVVLAQNRIDGRRVRRQYRRPAFWVLMVLALSLGLWQNFVVYFLQPDPSIGRDAAIFWTAEAGLAVALVIWGYVMFAIYLPALRLQKMVEYFGSSRRPHSLPVLAEYSSVNLSPGRLFERCYSRTAIALKRRPYNAGLGISRGFVDEEFARRLLIELEHEEIMIVRTAARFNKRQLVMLCVFAPIRYSSPRSLRRLSRRHRAHSRRANKIVRQRLPSDELRRLLDGYVKEPSE